jgi:hypothetical protein
MERIFARPACGMHVLRLSPVLESWEAKDHPDQRRLDAYLDEVESLVLASAPATDDRIAVDLTVGLPAGVALTGGGRDLDNYLFPIARRIGAGRIDAIFGRKLCAAASEIGVSPAARKSRPPSEPHLMVRTTVSSQSPAWKQQIHDACSAVVNAPLPAGAVALGIWFTVSSRRNWSTLWKPAIDALGPLLGTPDPRRPFSPGDDRIIDLALHRSVDDSLANDVDIAMWWHRPTE